MLGDFFDEHFFFHEKNFQKFFKKNFWTRNRFVLYQNEKFFDDALEKILIKNIYQNFDYH